MSDPTIKSVTEETITAQEIEDDNARRGIPKRERGETNGTTVLQDTVLDYYIGESTSPGLNARIPPFWSKDRDKFLRNLVLGCDAFLIAIYNVITKIVSLIPTVNALDKDNEDEVFAAKVSSELLRRSWVKAMLPALFDLLTQDNGMHIEILDGTNNPSKPLQPYEIAPGISIPAIGFYHWDSQRVTRTGNSEYPVVITGLNGKDYKVHKTRIISFTDMPSAKASHFGIGMSAASRVLVNVLQMIESEEIVSDLLFDGMIGEIIFGQPFTSHQLQEAFKKAEQRAQNSGEPRYRRFVYVGVQDPNPSAKFNIERIPLRRLPEGYEKASAVTLFMYLLASALGIDAREVWPATVSGATRADADVQHRKSQNKFTRLFINFMTVELEMKFAPMNSTIKFDFTDAAEELEKAEARKALVEAQEIELRNGTLTREVAAEQMHMAGYLTEAQLAVILAFTPLIDQFGQVLPGGQRVIVPTPTS